MTLSFKNASLNLGAEDFLSHIRTLIKNSGIYALSSLASPLLSFILATFLTHILSHNDYGALAVLITVISLVAGVTQFGLGSAFFRTYGYDYESQRDRLKVLSTVVVLLLLSSIPLTIAALIMAPWLAVLVFGNSSLSDPVRYAAVVILLQNLTVPGLSWLRAENRAAIYSALSIVNLLVSLGTTVIFVGVLHLGISGALLAIGGGYAVLMFCTLPVILLRAGLLPRFDIAWNLLSFGLPLVFSLVSFWVLQFSDRYLLSRLGSLAETAIYAVAYTLGGALSAVVLSPFSLAWPTAMFAIAKRDDATQVFRVVFRWFSVVLLLTTFSLSLIATLMLNIFFPSAYHPAATVIPIIAASMLFFGVYNVFTVGISVRRKTWLVVILITLAALVNVGLNLILIPRYGAMGAAISTLLAYILLALIAYLVNQRIYPVPFEIGTFLIALLVGIALYVGSDFLVRGLGIYRACAIYLSVLGLYSGCLIFLAKHPFRSLIPVHRRILRRAPNTDTLGEKDTAIVPSPFKVCMHVLGTARTDVRVLREATALVEAGFSVSIVDIESERTCPVEEDIRGIRVKHVIMLNWYTSRRFEPWFFIKAVQMLILSTLRLIQTSADVYHAHDLQALLASYIAARLRGKPLVFDSHELPPAETSIAFWRRLHGLLIHFLAWIVPRCAGVITVSLPISEEIRRRYHARKVTLIRNVPPYRTVTKSDQLRRHLGLSPDVRLVLYQGYLGPERELDRLIRAAPFLASDIVIVLMGKAIGTTLAQLEALIAHEGVAERVKIIPAVPYEELLDWTASADIGLIIYSPDSSLNVRMMLPNKLFEYLMAGLPVLSSQLDAIGEVIRTYDAGQIVSSLAPADVGAAINTMLADQVTLVRMRHNALEVARREFYWEKESGQLTQLYQDILARQNTGFCTDPEIGPTI